MQVLRAILLALGLLAAPAFAQPKDCAPLGGLPNYVGGDVVLRAYAAAVFKRDKGDDIEEVTAAGAFCRQAYEIKPGTAVMADLEIQTNYRTAIQRLGGQVTRAEDQRTYGMLAKDGQESWFFIYSQENAIEVTVVQKRPRQQTLTAPSGHDFRLVGHMPGYVADPPTKRNFDKAIFQIQEGDETKDVEMQGAKTTIAYAPGPKVQPASDLEIQENYRTALAAAGAQVVLVEERRTTARLEAPAGTIWIGIYSQETTIEVTVVEEKPFQPTIKPPEAASMKTALASEGRLVLYIPFDFDKATLRPEAGPVIAAIAKLLKDDPALKVAIEGHTDGVGRREYNLKLSDARANSVRAAVAAAGIDVARLSASGLGPDKPIADNGTAEGRAKNRRVELVRN